MAWTHLGQIANAGDGTANSATFAFTTTATAEVGHVLFMGVAKDNSNTTDVGDQITKVTDSAGNKWFRAHEHLNPASAQATTMASLWWTQITTELASGGTITLQLGGVVTANDRQCAWVNEFSVESGSYVMCYTATGTDTDAADPGAISLSSIPNEAALWVHVLAAEAETTDAYTWDADYTQITVAGSNSGTAASSQSVTGGFRIQTATSDTVDVTSDTADRDYAQILAVFFEVIPQADGGAAAAGGTLVVGPGVVVH